jgi:hypothetical protein
MDTFLKALEAYQRFDPPGWVALYKQVHPWAGIAVALVGAILLFFGGGRLFRVLAGPLGALIGLAWTDVVLTRLGLTGMDPRVPLAVAGFFALLGFGLPPAVIYLGAGIPVGLLGGEIAGPDNYLLGFGPGFIIGGVIAVLMHRPLSALLASMLGGWLLVLGAMSGLAPHTPHVATAAAQPWVVVGAAALFAVAGAVYQIVIRPPPPQAEDGKDGQRVDTRQALERRWSASQDGG